MSVASRNPFALLGDEDSPAVSVAAPAAKTEQSAPKRTIPGAGVTNGARGGAAPAARGGRGGARGGRAAAEGGANEDEAPQRESRGAARGAARGRGEGRGGARGGRGAGRGRGRAFDRHSQTGKEDSAKNIHQGWGGDDPKRELDVDENARADAAEEGANPAGETPVATNGAATPAEGEATEAKPNAVVEEEEKDNTKTLDEYLAEQAAKRAQIGAKKEARVADSADAEALGKRLEKQDSEDYYKIQKERQVRQREKKEKQVLEIEQSFNAPPAAARGGSGGRGRGGERGRGGRGGRGGERGRGAPRGGRGRGGASSGGPSLNLSDDSAFPTLG